LKVCKLLINSGADVTAKNLDGATALHYLARISNPENVKLFNEVMKLMLKRGAQVNETNRHLETPLHQAAMKGAVTALEFLVTHKAEPNMQNEFGETALHYAVRLGANKCIELLLVAGADVFLEGEREEGSALTLAEVNGQAEILMLMKQSKSYLEHVKKYGATLRARETSRPSREPGRPKPQPPAARPAARPQKAQPPVVEVREREREENIRRRTNVGFC
jgi:ankyrin repeat protein